MRVEMSNFLSVIGGNSLTDLIFDRPILILRVTTVFVFPLSVYTTITDASYVH